ncbi:hypothetical protein [Paenibacillus sp. OK003]|nr:hypothetical protein [Paenibacillus sp. OK003]SEK31901.1 hypothetical protein SAMN05518856_101506 [Paenibacillus sp. OK003]
MEQELKRYESGVQAIIDRICLWGENLLDRVYGDKNKVLENHFSE